MEFKAFKMDGLGNDFIIIDQRSQSIDLNKQQIIKICDRNNVGFDQLIFLDEKNPQNYIPIEYLILMENQELVEMELDVLQNFYLMKKKKRT